MTRANWWFGRVGYTATGITNCNYQMLPIPDTGITVARNGYTETTPWENGGLTVSRSQGGARSFDMSWATAPSNGSAGLDLYRDFEEGLYGTSPVYVSDPMNWQTNLFPPNWGSPMLGAASWPSIYQSVLTTAASSSKMAYLYNFVPNPSAESDLANWSAVPGTGGAASISISTTGGAVSGNQFGRTTWSTAATAGTPGFSISNIIVSPGYVISGAVSVRSSGATTAQLSFTFLDASNATIGSPNISGSTSLGVNTWTQIKLENITVPAGTAQMVMTAFMPSAPASRNFDGDAAIVTATGAAQPYFDGNTAPSLNTSYTWTGAKNDSNSYQTIFTPAQAATNTILTPTLSATATNSYSQPKLSATFNIVTAANTIPAGGNASVFIPVPVGYQLNLGASGTATGSGVVQVVPVTTAGSFATAVNLTLLSPTGATRMNQVFSGNTYCGVIVYLTRTSTVTSTVTLASMMAQIFPAGYAGSLPGQHIPGRGQGGLEFTSDAIPEVYVLNDAFGGTGRSFKGLSFSVEEVGSWRIDAT